MRIVNLAIGLLLFCCAAKYPAPPKKEVFIDTSALNKEQQKIVKESAASWIRQTRGCVNIVEAPSDATVRIIPMTSPDKYDDSTTYTLGMYSPGPRIIEIAWSKVDHDWAVVVVAHELGHAIGLVHNEGFHSLMSRNIFNAWLGLSTTDLINLWQVTGCDLLPAIEK